MQEVLEVLGKSYQQLANCLSHLRFDCQIDTELDPILIINRLYDQCNINIKIWVKEEQERFVLF